jgi:hypothetical protein
VALEIRFDPNKVKVNHVSFSYLFMLNNALLITKQSITMNHEYVLKRSSYSRLHYNLRPVIDTIFLY